MLLYDHRLPGSNSSLEPNASLANSDGWTDIIGKLLLGLQQGRSQDFSPEGIAKAVELADFEKMEEIRARVDATVKDHDTAEALKPYDGLYSTHMRDEANHVLAAIEETMEIGKRAGVQVHDERAVLDDAHTVHLLRSGERMHARQVLIATGQRWALLTETPRGHATLDELLALLVPCDLVIVEGFKSEGRIPRIEVRRSTVEDAPLFPHDPNVIAVAADFAFDCPLPVLDLNDADRIVAFITQRLALAAPR